MSGSTAPETYQAVAELDGGWWVVTVPSLRGVFSQGRTLDEARAMAQDAIASMLDIAVDQVSIALDIRGDFDLPAPHVEPTTSQR